jgi:hypothetical protein
MDEQLTQLAQALAAPFPTQAVNWKPQAVSKDKTRALAVAYIDARDVMTRLDEVVGAFNWQVKHEQAGDLLVTGLAIKHPVTGEWVWKHDLGFVSGSDSENEDEQMKAIKGTASDGLKRAAVLWGIGRYLYSLPKTWVGFDADKRQLTETPILPLWARPECERNGNGNGHKPEKDNGLTLAEARAFIAPEGKVKGKALSELDRPTLQAIASDRYQPTTPEGHHFKQAAALLLVSAQ